jgi:branched-chain amino acid transport system ATP-binding protein
LESSVTITDLHAAYGGVKVLHGISLEVRAGETVTLLGTNGNGKSTVIKCIMGALRPSAGSIVAEIDGEQHDLTVLTTEEIVDRGIAWVPEGRRLLGRLSVEENLLLGAYRKAARASMRRNLDLCYALFPVLRERRKQASGTMSGGEQQMVALARALMTQPKLLLIDEPSIGLAPIMVRTVIDKVGELKKQYGLTVLMAEQNFSQAIRIADRGYVIVHGCIAFEGNSPAELSNNDLIRQFYLGL